MSRAPKATYDLVLLPGDGIGAEVIGHARQLIDVVAAGTGAAFTLEEIPCGGKFFLEHGSRDWPEGSEARCAAADAILLGAVGWNGADGQPVTMRDADGKQKMAGWSPVIGNRIKLDLYANVRPVRCFPGTKHGLSGKFREVWSPETVDMVILRENTEGLYSGIGERTEDRATDLRVITRHASERVIRAAFELSRRRKGAPGDGKHRVTCIVKHNVLTGCRLFLEVFREVAKGYPDIEQDVAIVDSFAMFVLTQPERYDVCVTTNMFGDIVTDLASVLQGGMGMAVGENVGDDHAMFEPIHGSAPPLAGKDRANPMAMMLATGAAMAWLGRRYSDDRLVRAHAAIEDAVAALIARGEPLTSDLGGSAPQSVVAQAVRDEVQRRLAGP